eukprot:maker-scaffold_58-snap-gene-0.22-mRNA-1 protein AED:0.05 eAED:0.05 QI:108/1/0.88/1/1/1/9/108/564
MHQKIKNAKYVGSKNYRDASIWNARFSTAARLLIGYFLPSTYLIVFAGILFLWFGSWLIFSFNVLESDIIEENVNERGRNIDTEQNEGHEVTANYQRAEIRFYAERGCKEENFIAAYSDDNADMFYPLCKKYNKFPTITNQIKSARVFGNGDRIVDVYSSCSTHTEDKYSASIYPLDGCVAVHNYPKLGHITFTDSNFNKIQISPQVRKEQYFLQDHMRNSLNSKIKVTANIVFSCESSEYFGYQVMTNYYSFLSSKQKGATWTRLLTGRETDDLTKSFQGLATYQSKRHLFSRRYSPLNKADAMDKWFKSPDAPKEKVLVVIDPDNWLLKDLSEYYKDISRGQAIGEPAYYYGSRTAQNLWKELCEKNCNTEMDLVGVPYILHRDDMAKIAPLWKYYTLKIQEILDSSNPTHEVFLHKYKRLDLKWATEMFGYNMASAHVGVKHKVVKRIQVRDVDSTHDAKKLKDVKMLHIGRAWFPRGSKEAKKWIHTEGKGFSNFGDQVWCKCNFTGSEIMPWPVPEGTDFQSYHTLRLMNEAKERFGAVPENLKYRKGPGKNTYGWSMS